MEGLLRKQEVRCLLGVHVIRWDMGAHMLNLDMIVRISLDGNRFFDFAGCYHFGLDLASWFNHFFSTLPP